MTTINDLAKKLNLSTATVSRALNKNPNINVHTRERVEQMAVEMNYIGSCRLKNRNNDSVIGIICPEIISYNYASVAEAISSNLKRKGYLSIISVTDMDTKAESKLLEMFKKIRLAGIIVIMYRDATTFDILEKFRINSKIPIVQIANFKEYCAYDSLMISNKLASEMIVNYLYDLGHRDIGIVTDTLASDRLDAIRNRMHELGIVLKKSFQAVVPNLRFEEAGYVGAKLILKELERPTAIIATYDYMAIGVLRACYEMKIRVPEDISIIGIDDVNTSKYGFRALTTVSMPHADMGRIAARIIIDRINQGNTRTAVQHVSLNPELIPRETTAQITISQ